MQEKGNSKNKVSVFLKKDTNLSLLKLKGEEEESHIRHFNMSISIKTNWT